MNRELKISVTTAILAAIVIVTGAIMLSSCSHNGYGCTGRSKYITGYRSPLGKGY